MRTNTKLIKALATAAIFSVSAFSYAQDAAQGADDSLLISKPASAPANKSKLTALTLAPNLEITTQPKVIKSRVTTLAHVPAEASNTAVTPQPDDAATPKPAIKSTTINPPAVVTPQVKEVKTTPPPPDPRVTQILETPIPGVGKVPGIANAKNNVVRVNSDRNEVVYIAANHPNRIATPYKSPKALGKQGENEDVIKRVNSSLYITPADLEPIAIFVIGDKPNDPVFSLTLVPKDIPAQTIIAQLDSSVATSGFDGQDLKGDIGSASYVEKLNYLLKSSALGRVPEGYTAGALPKSIARGQYLSITPQLRYAGASYDIYRHQVTSTSNTPLELKEDTFYTPGVRAIGFFPRVILQPGEDSYVFIIHQREGDK